MKISTFNTYFILWDDHNMKLVRKPSSISNIILAGLSFMWDKM